MRHNPGVTSQQSAAAATGHASTSLYAKLAKRVVIACLLILMGVAASAVMYALTHESAATWAVAASIGGVVAVISGVRVGVSTAIAMGLLTPIAIVAGALPITGAALMALMCLTVGHLSRLGLHRATLLVPVFMAWMIIDPPTWGPRHVVDRADGTYLAWMGAIFFVGAIVPVVVLGLLLPKLHMPAPVPHGRQESVPYTVTITVLATVATYVVLHYPQKFSAGAWLIATILVLAQVGDVGTVRRTVERVVGTLLGVLVVSLIVLQVHSLVAIYVIGLIFAVAAVTAKFGPHYVLYMVLITPTVVCLNASSSSQVTNLEFQRASDTLIGAILVLLAAACTIGYAHLEKRLGHPPTEDVPTELGRPAAPQPT